MSANIALIVEADEPALFFSSIDGARSYLEPTDVNNGIYRSAFGPDGLEYDISADERHISIESMNYYNKDRLRVVIENFLSAGGMPYEAGETLDQMLMRCERFVLC